MKRLLLLTVNLIILETVHAQLLTWAPAFPKDNDNISITVDATKGNKGLQNYNPVTDVYVHVGLITNLSAHPKDWKYTKFNQNFNTPNAQLLATSLGGNKWRFDITNIRAYFGVLAGEKILRIAILFRNGNGQVVQRNANDDDMYIPVYDDLGVRFTVPLLQPLYNPLPEALNKVTGDNIPVTAIASQSSTMKLYFNGTVIQTATAAQTISASPVITTAGNNEIVAEADNGTVIKKDTIRFFVTPGINIAPLPAGVKDGINYEAGNTSVVLVLYAPGKTRVSVIGEFTGSNWVEQSSFVMNKTPDGNYWWLRISGLTPGTEYAFQYLVDGTLKVGEPYAEKILDPSNDPEIKASGVYPGLKDYPTGMTTGLVSILQTAAPAYNWDISNFNRPDKRNLIVYELLVRDFVATHSWNTLRDTLKYLKKMGVNAIEVMPFNEFEGNKSWGYNPDYFLAPDKYYGTKNALKQFIDSCHKNGIAVIMDIALNHTTGLNPLAALYWNTATNQPAANNPWLNVTAKHPFNVFNDFNHESAATQYFFMRVVEHWLKEYKLDGFRFDLSKGFTQVNTCTTPGCSSGTEVSNWGNYDATRVALWKKYYDGLQLISPGSYVILEHFAANNEEIELANYGMMLWGNASGNFQEAAMGWTANTNFDHLIYKVRNWSQPNLIGYMESHDEERMMYKNINFGNSSGSYNTRDINTSLKRLEMSAAFLLTMPGPKMIWQFGELGYDYSINYCENGTISDACRTNPKPIRWDYLQTITRQRLYDIYTSLNKLRFHGWYKDIFIGNNINITNSMTGVFKWMTLRSANDSSDLCIVGNFSVTEQNSTFTFPTAGTWYDYLKGATITATGTDQTITLQPGEFHIYLNRNLVNAVVTPIATVPDPVNELTAAVFPNPVSIASMLELELPAAGKVVIDMVNISGQQVATVYSGMTPRGKHRISLTDKINNLPAGTYLLRVATNQKTIPVKLVIP